jgi:hypothetical protein
MCSDIEDRRVFVGMIYFKESGVIEQSEIRRNKPNLKPKIVRANYGTFVSAASSAPSPTNDPFYVSVKNHLIS